LIIIERKELIKKLNKSARLLPLGFAIPLHQSIPRDAPAILTNGREVKVVTWQQNTAAFLF